MKRLHDLRAPAKPGKPDKARRGWTWQRPARTRVTRLRQHVVALAAWTQTLGLSLPQTADRLQVAARTLRHWRAEAAGDQPRWAPRGRPTLRSPRPERMAVLAVLAELGPATGVPTLRACFPTLPRAELADLVRRYRHVWQKRHSGTMYRLRWTVPGTVWAMDHTEAPQPLDGRYPYLLAVRDLASGCQLLWLPVVAMTAAETLPALRGLFAAHGAPLVLKTDNGSPFIADATQEFLAATGVICLLSPPHMPRYNGAIEAGIGSLKTRTERYATDHGRPGYWTWDDAAAALAEANATARPRGPTGPTPDALWEARQPVTPEQRDHFQATLARQRRVVYDQEEIPMDADLTTQEARRLQREAIRRALGEHDYLLFARRRIPLPITRRKTANIM